MKKILFLLAASFLFNTLQAQNVIYLFGMDANGRPVINTSAIPAVVNTGGWTDVLSKPSLVTSLTTTGTSGAATFNTGTGVLNIPNYVGTTYTGGTGINVSGSVITNSAPDQTVALTAGANIQITGTYPNFTIANAYPTINSNVTRPINSTTFTVSTTKQATVLYTVNISCTATIGSTATGKVALQYSTNGGSTWVDVSDVSNSNTVTLAVVLNSVTAQDQVIVGVVPANAPCRLVSTSAGTTSISYIRGQEIY